MTDVCGIGVRIVRAVMRRGDEHAGSGPGDAVDLCHGRHHVVDVLNDMRKVNALEAVRGERPRILVKIPNDIGRRAGGSIDTQRARLRLAGAAADVENDAFVDALVREGVESHELIQVRLR